jgi:hypothetical protein
MSLISIPAYLLKNTLQRWLENPASPITKILITFLFAVLALLVFGVFLHFESQIKEQLNRDDLRIIKTQEQIFGENAQRRLHNGTDESYLWKNYSERFNSFQQAPLLADTLRFKKVPLLSYDTAPLFANIPKSEPGAPRPIIVFSKHPIQHGSDYIKIQEYKIPAISLVTPPLLKSHYNSPAIAMVPSEIIEPLLERGFSQIQVILPKKEIQTAELETLIKAHAHAEGRRVNVMSSVGILTKLQEFLNNQKNARIIIGAVITAILSLTLGALSLLEFRQEQYLFALLRSFGVKKSYLFIHYLLETATLTFSGLWLAGYGIVHFPPLILKHYDLNPEAYQLLKSIATTPAPEDYQTLVIAITLGVMISSIPIALGLRKQTGLFLP